MEMIIIIQVISNTGVKFKSTAKFEKKLLLWIGFSNKGISSPIFGEIDFAINQEVYKNDFIKNKLIPFIECIFWSVLALSHYAKSVQNCMNEKKINFVKRENNLANVPECRPIEEFWNALKGKVHENNWQAENFKKLRNRIKYCLLKMVKSLVGRLSESIRR